MITVQARYYNILAAFTGARGEAVELPEGACARDLVEALAVRHPGAFRGFVLAAGGAVNSHLRLFRGDHPLELDALLSTGDLVLFFPAVAGG